MVGGSAGEAGLGVGIDSEGNVRTLHDAAAPEVVAITAAADGGAYVAVVGSEASFVDLQRSSSNGQGKEDDEKDSDTEIDVKESTNAATAGSRVRGFRGPRSSILHWTPSSPFESIWSFEEETIFDLVYTGDRLWVATGLAMRAGVNAPFKAPRRRPCVGGPTYSIQRSNISRNG